MVALKHFDRPWRAFLRLCNQKIDTIRIWVVLPVSREAFAFLISCVNLVRGEEDFERCGALVLCVMKL